MCRWTELQRRGVRHVDLHPQYLCGTRQELRFDLRRLRRDTELRILRRWLGVSSRDLHIFLGVRLGRY